LDSKSKKFLDHEDPEDPEDPDDPEEPEFDDDILKLACCIALKPCCFMDDKKREVA
jgi:hypothetical protein